jgi:hypothetical protein
VHHLSQALGVVLICLVEPHLQRRLHSSGIKAIHREAGRSQSMHQPRCHCACLDADPRVRAGVTLQLGCQDARVAGAGAAPLPLASLIHHANGCRLLRNVKSHVHHWSSPIMLALPGQSPGSRQQYHQLDSGPRLPEVHRCHTFILSPQALWREISREVIANDRER